MLHKFCHMELSTDVPEQAKAFYAHLFGWEPQDMPSSNTPDGNYTVIPIEDGICGGILKRPDQAPAGWMPYVMVADLEATLARAQTLGADICVERKKVPDMGALGIIKDPAGGMIGLWEPKGLRAE